MRKISWKYWIHHKSRALSVIGAIALAVASIMCCCFLVRGMISAKYLQSLDMEGNYNYIAKNVTKDQINQVEHSGYFQEVASLIQYGQVQSKNGTLAPVGYLDEQAQELYHYSCETGRYPTKANEIVGTRSALESMGVYPQVGEKVTLELVDSSGNVKISQEFHVSGILRDIKQERALFDDPLFVFPKIFIGKQEMEASQTELLLVENSDIQKDDMTNWMVKNNISYSERDGRLESQAIFLPMLDEMTQKNIDAMIQTAEKDFDSAVLIPLFSILICILSIISVYVAISIVLGERVKQLDLIRCLGLSQKRVNHMLTAELAVLSLLGMLFGMILGILGYGLILLIQANLFGQKVYPAYVVDKIPAAATLNPYLYPILLCGECIIVIAVVMLLFLNWKSSPYIKGNHKQKLLRLKHVSKKTLYRVVYKATKNEKRYQICSVILMAILMSVACFGSLYFMERTNQETQRIQASLKGMNALDCDYSANKDFKISTCGLADSNRHNGGIASQYIEKLEKRSDVKKVRSAIEARSTKFILHKDANAALQQRLAHAEVKRDDHFLSELDAKTNEKLGLQNYNVYNIPTLGVSKEQLKDLKKYLIAGDMDLNSMESGSDVVIIWKENQADCPFHVGDELPMTDIVKTDKTTEEFNFSTGLVPDGYKPSFTYHYIGDDGKEEPDERSGYVFGERVSYKVNVSGIIFISDKSTANFYQTASLMGSTDFEILCSDKAFENWKLPDRNVTKLSVTVDNPAGNKDFVHFWYEMIGNSIDMNSTSSLMLAKSIRSSQITYASFCIAILTMLCLIGMLAIINMMNREIRLKEKNMKYLWRLGMNRRKLCVYLLLQRIKYPLIGICVAWIPVWVFDLICNYIMRNVKDGTFSQEYLGATPWYIIFPANYELFKQPFIPIMIAVFVGGVLLMAVASLPSIHYIWKQLDKQEENTF